MRGFAFPPTTTTSDWHAPFHVAAEQTNYVPADPATYPNPPTKVEVKETVLVTWHPPDDYVVLGMSPDAVSWDDYGSRRIAYPPGRSAPAFFQASSNDGSGYVMLRDYGLIDILVPASVMRGFGVGELNVGLRFGRSSDGRTATIFTGRLPVVSGVI